MTHSKAASYSYPGKFWPRLEAGPTVEPASSRLEKNFLDKYSSLTPYAGFAAGVDNLAAYFMRRVLRGRK